MTPEAYRYRCQSFRRKNKAGRLADVKGSDADERIATGSKELDRVLGGGMVKGSLTLISGEPGIGKSTLLMQTADSISKGRP